MPVPMIILMSYQLYWRALMQPWFAFSPYALPPKK